MSSIGPKESFVTGRGSLTSNDILSLSLHEIIERNLDKLRSCKIKFCVFKTIGFDTENNKIGHCCQFIFGNCQWKTLYVYQSVFIYSVISQKSNINDNIHHLRHLRDM